MTIEPGELAPESVLAVNDYAVAFPDYYDDLAAFEIEHKGFIDDVMVNFADGRTFNLSFRDPGNVDLAHDATGTTAGGLRLLALPNLVIIEKITRAAVLDAVEGLISGGFFDRLGADVNDGEEKNTSRPVCDQGWAVPAGVPMKKTWCPRCDQGWASPIRVPALEVVGFVCDECDAFWPIIKKPTKGSFIDFGTFMESHGLKGDPNEVEFLLSESE